MAQECWSDYSKKLALWRQNRPRFEQFCANWYTVHRPKLASGVRALGRALSATPIARRGLSPTGARRRRSSASPSSRRHPPSARCRRRAENPGRRSFRSPGTGCLLLGSAEAWTTNSRAAWRARRRTSAITASRAVDCLVLIDVEPRWRITTRKWRVGREISHGQIAFSPAAKRLSGSCALGCARHPRKIRCLAACPRLLGNE